MVTPDAAAKNLANIVKIDNLVGVRRAANALLFDLKKPVCEAAEKAWFDLMAEIHANGKRGDYVTAAKYQAVKEELETYK